MTEREDPQDEGELCGRTWRDPFGEQNRCGKRRGHSYPCVATWAVATYEAGEVSGD